MGLETCVGKVGRGRRQARETLGGDDTGRLVRFKDSETTKEMGVTAEVEMKVGLGQ